MESTKMQPEKRAQGLAIVSLVLGIIGMLLACLLLGIIPAIIGLALGIIAFRKNSEKGIAIAGIITSSIGIGIFLLILIGVIGSLNGQSEIKKGMDDSRLADVEQAATEAADKTEEETLSDETEPTEVDTGFYVGEYLETKNEKLTYLSCDSEFVPDNKYVQPEDGNKIIRLEFEYENLGKADQSISFYNFTGYADGYKVKPWYYGDDDISGTISSGKKVKGAVYFEVPENSQEITVEYDVNLWTSEKAVFIVE